MKKQFLPYCINEWTIFKADIRNAISINVFNKLVVSEIVEISYIFVYYTLDVKRLTGLRLQCNYLNKHEFKDV